MEGERETIIFGHQKQRGKDLNVSGRSYDKHREAGGQSQDARRRKERIHHAQRARAYLKLIRGGGPGLRLKSGGQGAHAWTD